jgi:hypothetical protein
LEVKGYDMILGADWIHTHSPVGLDLRTRQFSKTKIGSNVVSFVDETLPNHNLLIGPKKLCQLLRKKSVGVVVVLDTNNANTVEAQTQQELPTEIQVLKEFSTVFQEPKTLPPERSVDYAISLIDMNKKTNQRPYRLPPHQKDAMEELIKQMLQNQMIRPSISPYSSPVIMVKKKRWNLEDVCGL